MHAHVEKCSYVACSIVFSLIFHGAMNGFRLCIGSRNILQVGAGLKPSQYRCRLGLDKPRPDPTWLWLTYKFESYLNQHNQSNMCSNVHTNKRVHRLMLRNVFMLFIALGFFDISWCPHLLNQTTHATNVPDLAQSYSNTKKPTWY